MNKRPYINDETIQLIEKMIKRCHYDSASAVIEKAVNELWNREKSAARVALAQKEREEYKTQAGDEFAAAADR